MANKMAEFPAKLAIFGQNLPKNAASLREAARGGVQKISKLRGEGVFWKFSISGGGGYFGYTPLGYPWSKPELNFVFQEKTFKITCYSWKKF